MPYIQYELEDGTTILVEVAEAGGVVHAARGIDIIPAAKKFHEAIASVRGSIKSLLEEFNALEVEETEVKFGLKSTGEAGIFAIGKVGGEMNYEVTLRWKKKQETPTKERSQT